MVELWDTFRKVWRRFTPSEMKYLMDGGKLSFHYGDFKFKLRLTGDHLELYSVEGTPPKSDDPPEIEYDELAPDRATPRTEPDY